MPPFGRTRYPHAFSASPIRETSQGSRRGARATEPPPPWHYPGGEIPFTPQTWLLHGLDAYAHCYGCGRHRRLDLQALIDAGYGARRLELLRPVCRGCGSRACYVDRK